MVLALGDEAELRDVVAVINEPLHEFFVAGFRNGFGAGHDPDVTTIRHTDDRGLVGFVEIGDEVGGLKGPDKLHTPFGIGLVVIDEAARVVSLERPCEIALVKNVSGRNRAIGVQLVTFDPIEGVVFDEGGNMCNDVPVTHEAVEVDASVDGA